MVVRGTSLPIFTLHMQREWGIVIGVGVHSYRYMFVDKKKILIIL